MPDLDPTPHGVTWVYLVLTLVSHGSTQFSSIKKLVKFYIFRLQRTTTHPTPPPLNLTLAYSKLENHLRTMMFDHFSHELSIFSIICSGHQTQL